MSYTTGGIVVNAVQYDPTPGQSNIDSILALAGDIDMIDIRAGLLYVEQNPVNEDYWVVVRDDDGSFYAVVSDEDFQNDYTEIP